MALRRNPFLIAIIMLLSVMFFSALLPGVTLAQTPHITETEFISRVISQSSVFAETDKRLTELGSRVESVTSLFPSPLQIEGSYESAAPFNDPDGGFSIGISQELDLYGKKNLRYHSAAADLRRSVLEQQQSKREYLREARTSFLEAYILGERSRISDSLSLYSEKIASAAILRKEKGDISPFEYNSITLESLKERSLGQGVKAEHRSTLAAIRSRFGIDLSSFTLEIDTLSTKFLSDRLAAAALGALVDSLPEIQLHISQIEVLQYQRSLAAREQLSNPNLGLSYIHNTLAFDQSNIIGSPSVVQNISAIRKDESQFGIKLSFSLPFSVPLLWQSGEYQTLPYDGAIARQQGELARRRSSLLAEVKSAIIKTNFLDSAYTILRNAPAMIAENFRSLERGYNRGELSLTDFLVNKKSLTDILQHTLDTEKNYHQSRIQLSYLINK